VIATGLENYGRINFGSTRVALLVTKATQATYYAQLLANFVLLDDIYQNMKSLSESDIKARLFGSKPNSTINHLPSTTKRLVVG